ncbi:MAG: mobilization protein, partial [Bacteroidales bacterium]|nr:mobilization protein [Bacteroidales bacterium]
MMAKIVKGSGARGIVDYILDKKKQATLIDCQGVLFNDNGTIAKSFIAQSRLNPRVDKFIGHISLSFSKQDLPRLTDELMIQISREYMEKMGIRDTQYIIGRHYDKEHPHVHIAFNRVDNNGRTISDKNDRYRSERICKELTRKYGLYFANGKVQVKTHRLKEPDKTRYEIYQVLKREVARCSDWTTLLKRLKAEGIDVRFKYKGNTNEVQGIIFTKNGYHFNGSKIDRSF